MPCLSLFQRLVSFRHSCSWICCPPCVRPTHLAISSLIKTSFSPHLIWDDNQPRSRYHSYNAAANSGPPVSPDAHPAKMHHLCKNVQKVIQNTTIRLLMILRISGPSLSDTAPVPEGHLSHIHFSYHKVIPVPVIHSAVTLEAAFSHPAQVSSFITT